MNNSEELILAKAKDFLPVLSHMANRHGLIAGATGTGKTVSLRVMAEHFSEIGVPVFMADVKGDLSGIASPGGDSSKVKERVLQLGLDDFVFKGFPVIFWDVFGQLGHPVRTTISEMGPLLLSRILNLNDIQSGVLSLIFRIADDNGLLLLDLKDLRAIVQFAGDNASRFTTGYGNISTASIGAIQRNLLALEDQGGDSLFGEPVLNLFDVMQTDSSGKGIINIMAADKLIQSPRVYATLLLWMLSELFEQLPEVGDPPKPKFVFFFDEAHLLFDDTPKVLVEKIEQVVRLIRSKGVGVYFVTQNPLDLPETILGQLGNRVQHALRAFTAKDQKAVKAAAETFRPNPGLDVVRVITELGVGEALVSFLDRKGSPSVVERAFILPPKSRLLPLDQQERSRILQQSLLAGHYERSIDRESAYEILKERAGQAKVQQDMPAAGPKGEPKTQKKTLFEAVAKSAAHAIGSQIGRQIIRGVLGSILGSGRK
ncbi:MAG: ATP-binding protein [Nitrospira bacterium SM23_35]|jgi:DNA helicase HerA-like ATPase|nr:MAG: ATP-binding protein [Nitrospira bacterium SM23_35]